MALFLAHCFILIWAYYFIARTIASKVLDQILLTAMLFWANIVCTSLFLASVHTLGNPVWFFRASLLIAVGSLLLRPLFKWRLPEPEPKLERKNHENVWAFIFFFLTLAPFAYASIRIASTYVPNNYDSLAYHLPRAMYYIGQSTLGHFDTGNPRQTFFPFNYNLLQLFALIYNPGLQCLNFINLLTWVISGVAVYRICILCGLRTGTALLTTWLALLSTQIFSQATATTNDLPTASALLTAIVFGLKWRKSGLARDALFTGLAAGLAAGAKLTCVYFGPAAVLLLAAFVYKNRRELQTAAIGTWVKPWIIPTLVAVILAAPFAIINLREKGEWMTKTYDFILNKPFSFPAFVQTSEAYLLQLFIEPLHRFTFNMDFTTTLNAWGTATFFPHWNETYAISALYLFPPDLNEDHVWFGFTGPVIFLAALFCLFFHRKSQPPLLWFSILGLGWMITFFALNKWSLYNQRYFVPAMLMMSPCLGAMIEASGIYPKLRKTTTYVLAFLVLTSAWLAGVYLFKNTSRPYQPIWAATLIPAALPSLPDALQYRMTQQARVNIDSDDGNERIFLLMAQGSQQKFTASEKINPKYYNVFSRWGFCRGMAYTNIEQLASSILVKFPGKKTAGVEYLGTMGTDVSAIDYFGLLPLANRTPASAEDANLFVTLSYGPRDPGRYAKTRIRLAGLNPEDHARLLIGIDDDKGQHTPLAFFTENGETTVSITQPFVRFTFDIVNAADGKKIGSGKIPHILRQSGDNAENAGIGDFYFRADLINTPDRSPVKTEGLAPVEGPYGQWHLPIFRWAKSPITRLFIPNTTAASVLNLRFSVRPQSRPSADIDLVLNGNLIKTIHIDGRETWFSDSLQLPLLGGNNTLEFRDVLVGTELDWQSYLATYPDVKNFLIANKIPLEKGAIEHYTLKGKAEGRDMHYTRSLSPKPKGEELYFLFRELILESPNSQ